jgi:hypothetical protein
MSAEWGGLTHDRAFRAADDGADDGGADDVEDELGGAWSEDLDTEFYAESSMTLPGESEPGTNCGVWGPQDFCDGCGDVGFGPSRCEQRGCPNCWWKWSGNRTEKAVVRLGAARYAADEAMDKRTVHTVASPPEGEIRTLVDVQQGFRDAYELAKERGVRGGVCIFHGFRVLDDVKQEFRAEDPDGGIWAWIRERPESWRSLTYWSPHYHIVGLARDVEADTGDESDVWRFRRIDRQGGRSALLPFKLSDKAGYDEMAGLLRYLLSHMTFESDTSKDSVRWFGSLSTAKFSPEKELSEGALSTIQRYAEEVVGSTDDRGDGDGHQEDCECEECGATSRSPIWEAGGALMDPSWCEEIGRENEARLAAAFEWAVGDRQPPPGLKRPTTREQMEEAFEAIL